MPAPWSLPGFELEQLLGSGSVGEVWRARELATGETVALKRLRPGAPATAVEALRREAALLRALDTPFVVRLRQVVGQGPAAVLVLDHAEGGTLADLLARRGRLEPGELVTVAAPLAEALAAAHSRGVVHGDVSPANVLFTADGMPLLADLGGGREPGDRGRAVDATADYLDPVVARGGEPDPASDVWALGAVCHAVLAGQPPHGGRTATEVLQAAASGDRAPLGLFAPHASRALVAVVESALDPDPAVRPAAADLAVALHRVQAAAPVRLDLGRPASRTAERRATDVVPRPAPPAGPPGPARSRPSARPGRSRSRAPDRSTSERRARQLPVAAGLALVAALLGAGLVWALRGAGPEPLPALGGATVAGAAAPASTSPAAPSGAAASPVAPSGAAASPAAPSGAAASPAAPSGAAASPAAPSGAAASPVAPSGAATSIGASPTTSPTASAPAATPDWSQVLRALDSSREEAFSRGDPQLLSRVWAAGSPAGRADTQALQALVDRGHVAVGVRHELRTVRPVRTAADRVELRIVDVLLPHSVLDAGGAVVERLPGRSATDYEVVLQRSWGAWRIAEVEEVA